MRLKRPVRRACKCFSLKDKQERVAAVSEARESIKSSLTEEQLEDPNLGSAMKKLEASILRGDVVKTGKRIDGRKTTDVRDIVCETGFFQEPMDQLYSLEEKHRDWS